jgi:hypothetical protein
MKLPVFKNRTGNGADHRGTMASVQFRLNRRPDKTLIIVILRDWRHDRRRRCQRAHRRDIRRAPWLSNTMISAVPGIKDLANITKDEANLQCRFGRT